MKVDDFTRFVASIDELNDAIEALRQYGDVAKISVSGGRLEWILSGQVGPARIVTTSRMVADHKEVSIRVRSVCRNERIETVDQLASLSAAELLRTPNFGNRSLKEVRALLDQYGLDLRNGASL